MRAFFRFHLEKAGTDQLPKVDVFTLVSVSGVDDSSDPGTRVDFKSRNENRISILEAPGPMLTPTELVALLKGQAFEPLEGGQLWKLRMSLPDTRGDLAMPTGRSAREFIRVPLC